MAGASKAKRGWAKELGVDPYTTNAIGFVEALEALGASTGRGDAVALAVLQAKDEEAARFYRRAAQILAGYAKIQGPIARLEN